MIRRCSATGIEFEISTADLAFYERMKVPLPTLSPNERQRRRLSWRNERSLHRRTCNATGASVVSIHHDQVPFPVYTHAYWWSDSWDPKLYGRDIDFNRPFFEQFRELQSVVPRIAMLNGPNENSDYVNLSSWNKSCFLLFESDNNRECLYCDHSFFCVSSTDLSYTTRSELCCECLYCVRCYDSRYLENCESCTSSACMKNCIGCTNCFGCVNLKNKQYWLWNKPVSKGEYEAFLDSVDLKSPAVVSQLRKQFEQHAILFPAKYYEGRSNEAVSGNYIWESKDCEDCFDCRANRDCRWVCNCENSKNCYDIDVYGGDRGMELVYEGHSVGNGVYNCAFNTCLFEEVRDSYYCDFCHFSACLFGCIGLRQAKFCILNKPYTEGEYAAQKTKLVEMMIRTGEWGEFFPVSLSPFAYNETVAQEYYPLRKEEAVMKGWAWRDAGEAPAKTAGAAICAECSGAFRYQPIELELYRKQRLPQPDRCYECRYAARMKKRLPRKLYQRLCAVSGVKLSSPYSPERPEQILSEAEYQQALE